MSWALSPSAGRPYVAPQLCLKIHFIARQLKERQLGNVMSFLKTSGGGFYKILGLRLAPGSWGLEVVLSHSEDSGSRVEGCRRTAVGTSLFEWT